MDLLSEAVQNYGLYGLFFSIFLSYSILPSLTIAPILISVEFFNAWIVFFVSMVAATLGSIVNYYIGLKGVRKFARYVKHHKGLKWIQRFLPERKTVKNAEQRIDKYGPFALLFLTWLPVIGDPIIIAAGALKMKFWKFLLYSTLSKILYLALIIFFGISLDYLLWSWI